VEGVQGGEPLAAQDAAQARAGGKPDDRAQVDHEQEPHQRRVPRRVRLRPVRFLPLRS